MVKQNQKLRFPVIATLILAGVFVFGSVAGAFVYATGRAVIETPYMQMVSHTEYRYSEPGQIIARLVDYQGDPVVVTNCTATILYPDKSYFVNAALMNDTLPIGGDHYYLFTNPAGPEGTYEYQATCYYGVSKQASVTNSFHLSSALGNILANQTAQNAQLVAIQGNLTSVKSTVEGIAVNLSAVNASLSGQVSVLSSQLNTNVSMLYAQADNNLATVQSQLNANTTQILNALTTMNVNLTPVTDAIAALDASMAANFTYTNGLITTLQSNIGGNFTVVTSNQAAMTVLLNSINNTVVSMSSVFDVVNVTTQNTYTYMTTTLTDKVDSVLTTLGVINATVNRIEVNTVAINATTSTILQNQQDAVQMTVFSG
jgi:hypothetical protein